MTREPQVGDLETLGRGREGVTLEKSPPPQHVHMTHHRCEHRPSVSRSPTCGSRVNDERASAV